MHNKISINLPQNIKIIISKNKKIPKIFIINLYNNNKKFKFYTPNKNILKIDKNTNTIQLDYKKPNYTNNKIVKFFFNFIKSWDIYFFKKIKFKGKGFRMRFFKKNKFVKFFFGKSHKTFILFKKISMKRINKYKFILKTIKNNKLLKNSLYATKIKPVNFYTLRGIRMSRQIIYKRKGKKGTYI